MAERSSGGAFFEDGVDDDESYESYESYEEDFEA